jgi:hypothetical protein
MKKRILREIYDKISALINIPKRGKEEKHEENV